MQWSTRAAPVPAHSSRSGSVRPLVAGVVLLLATGLSPARADVAAPPDAAPATTEPASVPGELLVGYRHGVSETRRSDARRRAGAERVGKVADERGDRAAVELVRVDGSDRAEATRRFKSNPDVAFAEPNWVYTHDAEPADTKYADGSLWGMYGDLSIPANAFGSQAAEAWAAERTGSDTVYVGIIDEGYNHDHPDLIGNAGKNPGESVPLAFETDGIDNDLNGYVDDVRGWDFVSNDKGVYDYPGDSHGTHVAGTIGATNNDFGVVGVNWNVSLLSGKFLGPLGGSTANAIKAVNYFTDLKQYGHVNVVATNNSWSGGGFSQGLKDAIANAGAQNIMFVAAAGNANANTDTTLTYPSGYDLPNVISVAAIDQLGNRASFSNYGVKSVDLGAPGVGIWSTQPNNTYGTKDGTSMAAPHVTGAVALYAAAYPARLLPEIRTALLGTVIATPALAGKTVTGGRLDVSTLLSGVIPPPPPPPANPRVVWVTPGTKSWLGTPITVRWTGYPVKVDIYRNGSKIVTNTTNDGLYTQTVRGPGTFLYKVCDTGKTANASCAQASVVI